MKRWFPPGRDIPRRSFAFFLPLAALLTVITALVYGAGQQVYRTAANDPQIQMARHDQLLLDTGATPTSVAAGPSVDLASSLDTHVSVYGTRGQVLASTARLHGATPAPPSGVLAAVSGKDGSQDWLTWQPQSGVRVAAVIRGWHGGAVLVGRSLATTEVWETDLEQLVLAAWFVGLLSVAVSSYVAARLWPASE